MSSQRSYTNTWVIVEAYRREFAVPASYVRELTSMPEVTAVPLRRPQDRGVINLRGCVIPLIDIRKHFGWPSVPEELDAFYQLMNQREQDHRNWLKELDRCVLEGDEFRLATDPHKCAFGKWYDSYRSGSPWIAALLRKFEAPHRTIHAVALSATGLVKAGKCEEAHGVVEQARNRELREMVSLFEQIKQLMRETVKELAMVITTPGKVFAVSIDQAVAVENIPPSQIKEVDTGAVLPGQTRKMAQRNASNSLAVVLEPETLVV
ncbi:MAG TPA: chemotaxis protein CheW [Bryobacteraceae bacterium]|nr:chemotaxis protein CheW [Bryobacteraceae bacterium]